MNTLTLPYHQIANLLDFLSAGVVVLSAERKVLCINRTAEMLMEIEADQVIGRSCGDVFGAYLCTGECLFDQAVRLGGNAISHVIEPPPSRNGGSLNKIVSPIYGPSGRVTACLEIFQDVSAFRELVERLGEESRKMREILDHLDIGVLTCDRGSHVTFFNAMAESITGFRRQELLGKSCRSVFNEAFCGPLLTDGSEAPPLEAREIEMVNRKGKPIPVKAKYLPLRNSSGHPAGMLTTFSDQSLVVQYRNAVKGSRTFYDMVSNDPKMQRIMEILPAVAETDTTVLIEGPTGSGKDLLAKVIHSASPRSEHPLVKVNCAALPDNLLESEMFGYVKGAFTGADVDKPGRFQEADGGTLFLDEIGDLPLALQAKLLRVIEDREFYPLGGRKPCRVNVRILSATNLGLRQMVGEKRFREDLYYRLNVMRIELPPLSERRSDIPLLIDHIMKRLCLLNGRRVERITEAAMEILLNHDYPGNVRELENILEHALILSKGTEIDRNHLPIALQQAAVTPCGEGPGEPGSYDPRDAEKRRIESALRRHNGHKGRTAAMLEMDRTTLWRKMKRYGIRG
ncbi:MAG: sigma 54-interacting transcriptional regulator [Desulfobacterales bacterium]